MSRPRSPRRRRAAVAALAGSTLLLTTGLLTAGTASASSHREAPLTAGDPQVDNTDVYAFVSPDDASKVTLIANWIPFEEPNGGPNFYPFAPGAHYDINIDSNGDAKPDLTYQWTFATQYKTTDTFLYNTGVVTSLDDPDLNVTQTYTLDRISYDASGVATTTTLADDAPVAPSNTGPASMPDYGMLRNQAVATVGAAGKSFAGQADDSFFLDLRVFDLLYGTNLKEVGQDTLSGYNVNTVALQLPKSELALNGDSTKNPVIGVWSSTERQTTRVLAATDTTNAPVTTGPYTQVSRLGMPLVNEVVIPLKDKDRFNRTTPANDTQFAGSVVDPEVPKLIQAIYGIEAPAAPRNDLVEVFLTGVCKTCGPIGQALGADLNSQKINGDVPAASFTPSEQVRLNMNVAPAAAPSRLGVIGGDTAGFPNGRRLTDDVVDIELQALEGALPPYSRTTVSTLGDAVDANDLPFGSSFPYVALPHNTAVNQ